MQDSFKINIRSLIGEKVELRTELIPERKYSDTFIFSAEPNNWELPPYEDR
jgi:hypothetical protein